MIDPMTLGIAFISAFTATLTLLWLAWLEGKNK